MDANRPEGLEAALRVRMDQGDSARMAAGYCPLGDPARREQGSAFRSLAAVVSRTSTASYATFYKVLPTHGMKGMVLYSTDAETREMLRKLI